MLTFLAALAVCALVAAPLFAGELRRRSSLPAAATVAGGNPWPAAPAVAAGRRVAPWPAGPARPYDRERVTQ